MADMLIKGMEMPKDGILRLVIFPNGRVDEINIYNEACMSTDSQAVAIPEHGRLIDADEAKELIVHAFTCSKKLTINDILGLIDNAPTIMEATK